MQKANKKMVEISQPPLHKHRLSQLSRVGNSEDNILQMIYKLK